MNEILFKDLFRYVKDHVTILILLRFCCVSYLDLIYLLVVSVLSAWLFDARVTIIDSRQSFWSSYDDRNRFKYIYTDKRFL